MTSRVREQAIADKTKRVRHRERRKVRKRKVHERATE
jgi:hypothetical protein